MGGGRGNGCIGVHVGGLARLAADLQAACGRRSWGGDRELGGNRAGHGRPKPRETGNTARQGWGKTVKVVGAVRGGGVAVRNGAREVHSPPSSNHALRSAMSSRRHFRSFALDMERMAVR